MGPKNEILYLFSYFFIPGMTKLALTTFFENINGTVFVFLFFLSCAIVHYPIQRVNSKGHLVNNCFSFVTLGIGVLSLPKT